MHVHITSNIVNQKANIKNRLKKDKKKKNKNTECATLVEAHLAPVPTTTTKKTQIYLTKKNRKKEMDIP